MEKLNARWDYGIFVGVRRRSNEIMLATREGITKSRSIKRIPEGLRWGEDCVRWVRWVPWNRYRDDEMADGDLPEEVPAEESGGAVPQGDRVVYIETKSRVPRDFYSEGGCREILVDNGVPWV